MKTPFEIQNRENTVEPHMLPTQIAFMDTAFFDDRVAYEREKCEIRIDANEIVVSYDDGEQVIYRGKEKGQGHYVLECP